MLVAPRRSFGHGWSRPDENLHSTDPKLYGERVNIIFRWLKNHLPQCPLGAGVVCCQRETSVAGTGTWGGSCCSCQDGRCCFWPPSWWWDCGNGRAWNSGWAFGTHPRTCVSPVVMQGRSLGTWIGRWSLRGVLGVLDFFGSKSDCPVFLAMTRVWF